LKIDELPGVDFARPGAKAMLMVNPTTEPLIAFSCRKNVIMRQVVVRNYVPSYELNKAAWCFHFVFWICAFGIWLAATTGNHPDWIMRILATAILVGMSALYSIRWAPRKLTAKHLFFSSLALLGCGLVTAIVIRVIYDAWIGPDPRRFSLLVNLAMDTAVLLVNTVLAAVVAWTVKQLTGRPVWMLRPAKTETLTPIGNTGSQR
jgi:hypothetical protein